MQVVITKWNEYKELIESVSFYGVRSVSLSHCGNPHIIIFFEDENRSLTHFDIDPNTQSVDIH